MYEKNVVILASVSLFFQNLRAFPLFCLYTIKSAVLSCINKCQVHNLSLLA